MNNEQLSSVGVKIGYVMVTIAFIGLILVLFSSVETINKIFSFLLPITAAVFLMLVGIPAGLVAYGKASKDGGEKKAKQDYIFQTPENHVSVVRTALWSEPGDPTWGIERESERLVLSDDAMNKLGIKEEDMPDGSNGEKRKIGIVEFEQGSDYKKFRSKDPKKPTKLDKKRDPVNYFAEPEGWGIYLPGLSIFQGMVSLQSTQTNHKEVQVTSRDSLVMYVNAQSTKRTWNAKRLIANMPGETADEKNQKCNVVEADYMHTALNKIFGFFTADELQAKKVAYPPTIDPPTIDEQDGDQFQANSDTGENDEINVEKAFADGFVFRYKAGKEKPWTLISSENEYRNKEKEFSKDSYTREWGREVKTSVLRDFHNPKNGIFIKCGGQTQLGAWTMIQINYGLSFKHRFGVEIQQLGIQDVLSPTEVQAAMARRAAAQIEQEAAPDEAEAIRIITEQAGVNPNVAMVAHSVTDLIRTVFGKGSPSKKSGNSSEKKTKQNKED